MRSENAVKRNKTLTFTAFLMIFHNVTDDITYGITYGVKLTLSIVLNALSDYFISLFFR